MRVHLVLAAALAIAGCGHHAPASPGATPKSTAQLLNTYWKLTQLGDQVISTPQDAREIHLLLQSENPRVAGFSGCNQMMGAYVLNGSELRFDQMGGTLMACTANMELERNFLAMFSAAAGWEIQGETLKLLDGNGKPLAVFESRYLK